ncbi:M20/M25/M40 family metallo-hydrolase [Limnochorda pilosa]|uniref:Peptidase M20 n=1 Tax=Limnochorda pilosa TaxID=1555112 RepID=A0A0K2SNZ5_LIMPI|nr:M20/M25/M40 family metallo-hydrolase [Limnochorda pilosa]BAS28858.1 peptidase M20 [Limnochorda pilosa]
MARLADAALGGLAGRKELFLQELLAYCRQPSVAATGEGMEAMAGLVSRTLERLGAEVEWWHGPGAFPVIYGRLERGAPVTLLFYNHYDVQPPEPLERWTSPPFEPRLAGDRLHARGVADDKGALLARLHAVELLQQVAGGIPVNVIFLVEGGEEVGSPGLGRLLSAHRRQLQADGCLWEGGEIGAHGRLEVEAGCKGMLYVELVVRGPREDLHSSLAGLAPNPVWHLLEALRTLYDPGSGRILVDGFYDRVRPPSPEELSLVDAYPLDEGALAQAWGLVELESRRQGRTAPRALFVEPTCNVSGIFAGYAGPGSKTVLPSEARARVDFRLVPNQSASDCLRKLEHHLARRGFRDVRVVDGGSEDPGQSPLDHPLVERVAAAARETYGVDPILKPRSAGTGPAALFVDTLGLPVVNGPGVAYHGSGPHAPDEHIRLGDYWRGIEHVVRLLAGFDAEDGLLKGRPQ